MKYFIISLIAVVILLTPFGLTEMNHNITEQNSCLGLLGRGKGCSENVVAEIEHHISFFQSFSETLVNQVGVFLLIFGLLLLPFLSKIFTYPKLIFRKIYFIRSKFYSKYSFYKILDWFSLLTKSPPLKIS